MQESEAYVYLLRDTLKRKKDILLFLLNKTNEQQKILVSDKMDVAAFEQVMAEKKVEIDTLVELDEGFESVYQKVSKEMQVNRDKYKDLILQMQALIKEITDLSMQVQSREHQNSEKFKLYLAKEKSAIRESKVSSRTAASYYQNMANQHHSADSYFLNTTK